MGRTACTEPQCLYKGDLYLFIDDIIPIYCEKLLHFLEALCFMHFTSREYRSSMALFIQDHKASEVQTLWLISPI
jgi:hypothetical protein